MITSTSDDISNDESCNHPHARTGDLTQHITTAGIYVEKGGQATQNIGTGTTVILATPKANPTFLRALYNTALGIATAGGTLIQNITVNISIFGNIRCGKRTWIWVTVMVCLIAVIVSSYNQFSRDHKFCQVLKTANMETWKGVEGGLIHGIRTENLLQPDFEVYPQMALSTDFYAKESEGQLAYVKENMLILPSLNRSQENQFKFENLEEIILNRTNNGLIGLFASMGAGKTTCMRRLARNVINKSGIFNNACWGSSFVRYLLYLFGLDGETENTGRFRLVLFLNMSDIVTEAETTLERILLGGLYGNDDDMRLLYKWMMEDQAKVAIFLDGLDRASWSIPKHHNRYIKPYKSDTTATIMHNLLSRHLLSDARVVISSRQQRASNLPKAARPRTIVTLTGFSEDDANRLFMALISPEFGNDSWHNLITKSPLQSTLSTPIYLVMTAVVYNPMDGHFPTSITRLMARYIKKLLDSDNLDEEAESIIETVQNLTGLAYEGVLNETVAFTETHVRNRGIDLSKASNFLYTVRIKTDVDRDIGELHAFFSLQILQEYLSACFIADMDLEEFENFTSKINDDQWHVVRRFLYGIVFNSSGCFGNIKTQDEKKKRLNTCMAAQLKNHRPSALYSTYRLLESYSTLYESNDVQLVDTLVHEIVVDYVPLSQYGIHVVASIISRRSEFNLIQLTGCWLRDSMMTAIGDTLKGKKIKVKRLILIVQNNYFEQYWKYFLTKPSVSFSGFNSLLSNIDAEDIYIDISHVERSGILDFENIKQFTVGFSTAGKLTIFKFENILTAKFEECQEFAIQFHIETQTIQFDVDDSCQTILPAIALMYELFRPNKTVLKGEFPQQYISNDLIHYVNSLWDVQKSFTELEIKKISVVSGYDCQVNSSAFEYMSRLWQTKAFTVLGECSGLPYASAEPLSKDFAVNYLGFMSILSDISFDHSRRFFRKEKSTDAYLLLDDEVSVSDISSRILLLLIKTKLKRLTLLTSSTFHSTKDRVFITNMASLYAAYLQIREKTRAELLFLRNPFRNVCSSTLP